MAQTQPNRTITEREKRVDSNEDLVEALHRLAEDVKGKNIVYAKIEFLDEDSVLDISLLRTKIVERE